MKYIRIAGNTEAPCYLTLLEKGYEVKILECHLTNEEGTDCRYEYEAQKPGSNCAVSATTIYELLALVVMGETRGFAHEEWKPEREEIDAYFDMKDSVLVYDVNGQEVGE